MHSRERRREPCRSHGTSEALDENVSHRAIVYMEEFTLSAGLDLADALIAATAAEHKVSLCTANDKHYRKIPGLTIARFRP